jgi:hypothetical protein
VQTSNPSAWRACIAIDKGPGCLNKAPLFFARDRLHFAAVGRVPPHRFIEKVKDMTKTIAPREPMSMADRVTYGMVGGVFVLAVFAFIFLQ